jgi:hypothetical protein
MGQSDIDPGQLLCFRGDNRTAFRLTRVEKTNEEDWRSHYHQGLKPRGVEVGSALNHMGLSMWSYEGQAYEVNQHFGGRLGHFIVAVELRGEDGVWFAETGVEGHLAVWGRPEVLQRSVLAVSAI